MTQDWQVGSLIGKNALGILKKEIIAENIS